jgi:predicted  nucleic acid-binding Zn-ribbon protein
MWQCEKCGALYPNTIDFSLPCPACGGQLSQVGNVEHGNEERDEDAG